MNDRLTKSSWIRHGLRTLATEGADALKVGPMAAKLHVTRGSFYWHFQDIADFRSQVLRYWQEHTTDQVIQEMAEQAESDRLKHLMQRAFVGERDLDRAIRAWAVYDEEVAAVVASTDARRIAYIAKLFALAGVKNQRALDRAAFVYWAYLGQTIVMASRHSSIAASGLDEITALFERSMP